MTSKEIKNLLEQKYSAPVYAFFTEVAKGGVGSFNGYIDGIAYSLYPSMSHEIHGFEIKVSRSDWLKELEMPAKAGDAMQHCNRWWLVAPKGVALKDEVPKSWGFYEIINGKFYKRKPAPAMETTIDLAFIAGLLRRATEGTIPVETLHARIAQEKEEIAKNFKDQIESAEKKLEKYRAEVEVFEKTSGIEVLDRWKGPQEVAEAVKFVLDGGLSSIDYNVNNAIDNVERMLVKLKTFKTLKEIKLK